MELSIDTSTAIASLALSEQGAVVAELTWRCGQNHTVELLPSIERVLEVARVQKSTLTAIVVAIGPGSFNGLRVGMATAKGLSIAFNIPLVGVSTLEVEAMPHLDAGLPVCPIHDAGRGELAAALFQQMGGERRRLWEEQLISADDLIGRVTGETVFCGEIPTEVAHTIRDRLGAKALIVAGAASLRRAGFLAELGWARLSSKTLNLSEKTLGLSGQKGDSDDLASLQPLYLRRPPITVPKSSRRPSVYRGSGAVSALRTPMSHSESMSNPDASGEDSGSESLLKPLPVSGRGLGLCSSGGGPALERLSKPGAGT